MRSARAVRLSGWLGSSWSARPSSSNSCASTPGGAIASRYGWASWRSNCSLPAGTGVWVVKTVVRASDVEARGRRGAALLQRLAQPLHLQQGAVALVDVPDAGLDAQGGEGLGAADPENRLLGQAHLAPAHVEHAGDRPVRRVIGADVGVEQQHRHPPHLGQPDARRDHATGHRHLHHHPPSATVQSRPQRQTPEVVLGKVMLLDAVGVDRLAEVAAPVGQAHRHERQPQVAGALAVVAAQDPETARVDGQALVDAVLHREVGDRSALVVREMPAEPGRPLGVQVAPEVAHHRVVGGGEGVLFENRLPVGTIEVEQHLDRIAAGATRHAGEIEANRWRAAGVQLHQRL